MIVRIWRGWTRTADAAAYEDYLLRTGFPGYTSTPGNQGVRFARHDEGDRTEFLLISFWESWAAIEAFAGEDPSQAVFYAEDEAYLVDRDRTVTHYEVFASA